MTGQLTRPRVCRHLRRAVSHQRCGRAGWLLSTRSRCQAPAPHLRKGCGAPAARPSLAAATRTYFHLSLQLHDLRRMTTAWPRRSTSLHGALMSWRQSQESKHST